jgi:DNA-binding winged helix-turn-helix (wHTH) protein
MHSHYLQPFVPLAVALPRILANIEAKMAAAATPISWYMIGQALSSVQTPPRRRTIFFQPLIVAQIIRALRRRSRRDRFDVHQGQQSRQLLRLSDRGMTVMDKPAVFECTYQKPNGRTIQTGKLVVELDSGVVSVDHHPVRLTSKEYDILELLSLRTGTIVTKDMILHHLYGGMDEPEVKIIDVFVCNLRRKLAQATGGSHYIETVWGRGYVLRDPTITSAAKVSTDVNGGVSFPKQSGQSAMG